MGTQRITARVWDREQSTNREYVLEFTASCGSVKVTSSAVIEAGQHMGYPVEDELVNEGHHGTLFPRPRGLPCAGGRLMHFGPLRGPLHEPPPRDERHEMIEAGFIDYGKGIRKAPKGLTKNQKRWWRVGQTEARLIAKAEGMVDPI